MKQCTRCLATKLFTDFYKQTQNSKDGYQAHCKVCDNARVAARKAKDPERAKRTQAVSDRNKYAKNKATIRLRNKTWKVANPDKLQAADAKRRAARLQRTPAWLTEDELWMMEQAYELAALRAQAFGFEWHVDHVVPLQGKLASGLHVPHNLQVIPAAVNLSKSNKFVAV
jgi:hypothetical protein